MVIPETSRSALRSTLAPKVDTPVTFKVSLMFVMSNSVRPSTSRSTPIERVEPSKVRLASSSSSPPDPTMTTLLSVRSSTLKVFASAPALISTNPPKVDAAETFTLSNSV